jgi:hypothetical protein
MVVFFLFLVRNFKILKKYEIKKNSFFLEFKKKLFMFILSVFKYIIKFSNSQKEKSKKKLKFGSLIAKNGRKIFNSTVGVLCLYSTSTMSI